MDFHHILRSSPSSSTSSAADHHLHHPNGTASLSTTTTTTDPTHSWWESISKARTRIHLLSSILSTTTSASDHPPTTSGEDPLTPLADSHLYTTATATAGATTGGGGGSGEDPLSSLADSDRPARSLLLSASAYTAIAASLASPFSGSGEDPLCHWLYDTFLSADPDLRLVVLSFIPLLTSIYLSRIHSSATPSLSGLEAVLLAIYSSEVKARGGKAVVVHIPDLGQPSLYHRPQDLSLNVKLSGNKDSMFNAKLNGNKDSMINGKLSGYSGGNDRIKENVGVLCAPLEPQIAVKSTKRGCIVGVALDCYYKQISHMPSWSKVEFCRFAEGCGGEECACISEFDEVNDFRTDCDGEVDGELRGDEIVSVMKGMENLGLEEGVEDSRPKRVRIPLPWELFQPILRILGHCLLGPLNTDDVKDAASVAIRRMYARASHQLNPQAILATRSLIRLDKRSREAAQAATMVSASSNSNTPSKAKKPEILLVSK